MSSGTIHCNEREHQRDNHFFVTWFRESSSCERMVRSVCPDTFSQILSIVVKLIEFVVFVKLIEYVLFVKLIELVVFVKID